MTDEECPLTANPCRHCSDEHAYRPYMKLEKDSRTNLFKPAGLGQLRIDLGHYCNNIGCWCHELESCPMPDDLIRQGEMIDEYNKNKEKERVKEERKKARKKVVKKVIIKKQTKRPTKVTKTRPQKKKVVTNKPVKKPIKSVTKRKL